MLLNKEEVTHVHIMLLCVELSNIYICICMQILRWCVHICRCIKHMHNKVSVTSQIFILYHLLWCAQDIRSHTSIDVSLETHAHVCVAVYVAVMQYVQMQCPFFSLNRTVMGSSKSFTVRSLYWRLVLHYIVISWMQYCITMHIHQWQWILYT